MLCTPKTGRAVLRGQLALLGRRGRQQQPGIGDQALVVEGHGDGVEAVG